MDVYGAWQGGQNWPAPPARPTRRMSFYPAQAVGMAPPLVPRDWRHHSAQAASWSAGGVPARGPESLPAPPRPLHPHKEPILLRLDRLSREVKALRKDAGYAPLAGGRPLLCATCGKRVGFSANFCSKCGGAVVREASSSGLDHDPVNASRAATPGALSQPGAVRNGLTTASSAAPTPTMTKRASSKEKRLRVSTHAVRIATAWPGADQDGRAGVDKSVSRHQPCADGETGASQGLSDASRNQPASIESPAQSASAAGLAEQDEAIAGHGNGEVDSSQKAAGTDTATELDAALEPDMCALEEAPLPENASADIVCDEAASGAAQEAPEPAAGASVACASGVEEPASQPEAPVPETAAPDAEDSEHAGPAESSVAEVDSGEASVQSVNAGNHDADGTEFGIEDMAVGEELGASKPWVGTLNKFRESGYDGRKPPEDGALQAPRLEFHIDHVFGYRGSSYMDGKSKVGYTQNGAIVSNVGMVGMVEEMDHGSDEAKKRHQTHFRAHCSEITCLTMDASGEWVATGDSSCHIYVWSALECVEEIELASRRRHEKGIGALSFSRDRKMLVSIGKDDDHNMIVWNLEKARQADDDGVVDQRKCDRTMIFDVVCNPYDTLAACSMVTVGKRHLWFWDLDSSGKLQRKKCATEETWFSVDFIGKGSVDSSPHNGDTGKGYAVTGAVTTGVIMVWSADSHKPLSKVGLEVGHKLITVKSCMIADRGFVMTGDDQGHVQVWSADSLTEKTSESLVKLDVSQVITEDGSAGFGLWGGDGRPQDYGAAVRSLAMRQTEHGDHKNFSILIATGSNQVIEACFENFEKGSTCLSSQLITQGHSSKNYDSEGKKVNPAGELWGLATHPSKAVFATAGDDAVLRLWGLDEKCVLGSLAITTKSGDRMGARTCAFRGETASDVALGLRSGEVLVVASEHKGENGYLLSVKARPDKIRSREITVIRYSRDGSLLAAGSKENKIDIYRVCENAAPEYVHVATCEGHSGAVAHLDWDETGMWIQSVDTSYELLFWNIGSLDSDASSVVLKPYIAKSKDTPLHTAKWHTMSCPFTWSTIGVIGSSGASIKAIDRDEERSLLVATNDKQHVCVYAYPTVEGAKSKSNGGAHSSKVTNLRFINGGRQAVSIGGKDLSCIVWDLVRET